MYISFEMNIKIFLNTLQIFEYSFEPYLLYMCKGCKFHKFHDDTSFVKI